MNKVRPSLSVTNHTARILAVVAQGLHKVPPRHPTKRDLLRTLKQLGVVQLDAVSAVTRSHYLVFQSRVGVYDPSACDRLLFPDRLAFEQVAHEACLIPAEYFGFFHSIILNKRRTPHKKLARLGARGAGLLDQVLATIGRRGPLLARDLSDGDERSGSWWDWRPTKYAIEILFEHGYLMVQRREGFQRRYELTERLAPAKLRETLASARMWAVEKALSCLGIATETSIRDYFRLGTHETREALRTLVRKGVVLPCVVRGWSREAFVRKVDIPTIKRIEAGRLRPSRTTLLSPFDNLIWDRARVQELFGFAYKSLLYLPRRLRKASTGYYVMPILHNGALVGRVDPRMDRSSGTLVIKSVTFEPHVRLTSELLGQVTNAIKDLLAFNRGHRLRVERRVPLALRRRLQTAKD